MISKKHRKIMKAHEGDATSSDVEAQFCYYEVFSHFKKVREQFVELA